MSQQWDVHDEEAQVPLGAGGDAGAESTYVENKGKFNTSTLALVASFVAALLVIYLLGLQNKPRSASAEQVAREQEVQSAITELLEKNGKAEQIQGLFKDTNKLVKMFYSYLGAQGGEPPELAHDPFGPEGAAPSTISTGDFSPAAPRDYAEAEKLRRVAETFNGLKLQSVMVSRSMSTAMINNKMVTVGAKFGDLMVTEIEATRVVLAYEKNKFELKLARPEMER